MTERVVVLVSGSPAAGKTTLARPLAGALALPLLSKDVLKERLFDSLGPLDPDPVVSGQRFGGLAMDLIWRLAEEFPGVLIETNFLPRDRQRLASLSRVPVEVHCACPPEEALRRYAERSVRADLHPVHRGRTLTTQDLEQYREPLAVGPVIAVDTTRPVDVEAVADLVAKALP